MEANDQVIASLEGPVVQQRTEAPLTGPAS
jgi:hypothetical protein